MNKYKPKFKSNAFDGNKTYVSRKYKRGDRIKVKNVPSPITVL